VLSDEAIVVNFRNSSFYNLNLVGTFIWERCDGQHTLDQIATELGEEYDVPPEEQPAIARSSLTPWWSKGYCNRVMPRVRHEVS